MLLDILIEGHARHLFHDVASQSCPVVGISSDHPRGIHTRGHVGSQPASQRLESLRTGYENACSAVFEACCMGQQIGECNWLREGSRNFERLEVCVHIGVQIHLALFGELHHCGPGEQLAYRADTKEGRSRADRLPLLNIGLAISTGKEKMTVLDYWYRCSWDMVVLHLRCHDTI